MEITPKLDIWLLIPAYNVGRHLESLLTQALTYVSKDRILVVNDGSVDDTAKIANLKGVTVISNYSNLGKGVTLRKGFQHIFEQGGGWIITIDGDLQHNPDDLPAFISCAKSDIYDIVIGNRTNRGGMPLDRQFSNWLTSSILSLITRVKIKDGQCGYRLLRASRLKQLELFASYYDFETECLLKLISHGAKIGWVPIETIYLDELSSIHRFRDTVRFIKVVLAHIIRAR